MYSTTTELTKNINELQSDVLGEKLSSNPLMKAHKLVAKNKALNTKQQTVVNAINELLVALNTLSESTANDLGAMYSKLGNFSEDASLDNELIKRNANTVLALAANAYDETQKIKDFAQDDYEDIFHVDADKTQTDFVLTHKPVGKIRMYIDGLRYFKECIEYDEETNTVKWVNDSTKPEGFDITDADVVFEYDYVKDGEGA